MAFKLASGDSTFNNRVDALFESLEKASKEANSLIPTPLSIDQVPCSVNESNTDFKKPTNYPPRRNTQYRGSNYKSNKRKNVPDYIQNPNKWKCYSLEDIDCQSNSQNREIASQLLSSLKTNSDLPYEEAAGVSNNETSSSKIEFKKPVKICPMDTTEGTQRRSDRHFVLPKYEVGQQKNKIKKTKSSKCVEPNKMKQINLSYLEEDENESE